MNNEMTSLETPRLRLPLQVAPVERKVVAAGPMSGSGLEASGWLDDLQQAVGIGGQIAQAAGPLLGAFGI